MVFEDKKNKSEELTTDNIFDDISYDFSQEGAIGEEATEEAQDVKRMAIIKNIIFGFLIVSFVALVTLIGYVSFQKSELKNTFLPGFMCSLFSGEANVDNSIGCSSVTSLIDTYNKNIITEKFDILKKQGPLIEDVYQVEDFFNSREVVFLADKSDSKIKPLEVLEAFDDIKTNFSSLGKSEIECKDIVINSEGELTTICEVYSYDWQSDINGTSQSLAALFQKEFEDSKDFMLLEKQRVFESLPTFDKPMVTRKTELRLKLKYQGGDTINL